MWQCQNSLNFFERIRCPAGFWQFHTLSLHENKTLMKHLFEEFTSLVEKYERGLDPCNDEDEDRFEVYEDEGNEAESIRKFRKFCYVEGI